MLSDSSCNEVAQYWTTGSFVQFMVRITLCHYCCNTTDNEDFRDSVSFAQDNTFSSPHYLHVYTTDKLKKNFYNQ